MSGPPSDSERPRATVSLTVREVDCVDRDRERLLMHELCDFGLRIAKEARADGEPVPQDFEQKWRNDVCGSLACGAREGWPAYRQAVEREIPALTPHRPAMPRSSACLAVRLISMALDEPTITHLVPGGPGQDAAPEKAGEEKTPKGKRDYSKRGELPKYVVEGLVLIQQNPSISDAKVAREVKRHPSTLSHNKLWRERSASLRRDLLGREPQGGRKDDKESRVAAERARQRFNDEE
jgi:hypothetical protein